MKTLQVVGNSAYGGATYLILNWCRFLLEQGCKVDIIATDLETVRHLQEINGVNILQDIFIPREISLRKHALAFSQLLRLVQANRYHVLHTYTATPGFVGRIAGFIAGTPVVLHHGAGWTVNDFSSLKERIVFTLLENIIARLGTKIICVSEAVSIQAQKYKLAPPNRLVVIPNGIDPEPFLKTPKKFLVHRRLGLSQDVTLVGSTSRLSVQKDVPTLLHAFTNINENPLNKIHLVLAGDGPDKESLLALAQTLGIQANTHFLGFLSDIPAFLADIDLFVSSTLWEGLSISILEAMAAAKPIIATNILPNQELLNDGESGILVPPKDPLAIQEAILGLSRDGEKRNRLGRAARKRVMDYYTIDRMFESTWDLYINLLSRAGHQYGHDLSDERV